MAYMTTCITVDPQSTLRQQLKLAIHFLTLPYREISMNGVRGQSDMVRMNPDAGNLDRYWMFPFLWHRAD